MLLQRLIKLEVKYINPIKGRILYLLCILIDDMWVVMYIYALVSVTVCYQVIRHYLFQWICPYIDRVGYLHYTVFAKGILWLDIKEII